MLAVIFAVSVLLQTYMVTEAQTSSTTTAPTRLPAPAIEYNCMTDKSIVINLTNFNKHGYYKVDSDINGSSASNITGECGVPVTGMLNTTSNINLKNCSNTVYLFVMEEDLTNMIVGGKNFYEYKISCELPAEGIVRVVNASLIKTGVSPTIFNGTANFPGVNISMTIDKPSPTIGEEVHITIKEIGLIGGKNHYIIPMNCSAKGVEGKENLLLFANSSSLEKDIMTNFTVNEGNSTASLYAFRFITSDSVRLECTVVLCNNKNCTSGQTRRRRAVQGENGADEFKVSAEYQIREYTSGQSQVAFNPVTVIFFVLAATVVFLNWR